MALSQADADNLLRMPKSFEPSVAEIVFSETIRFDQNFELTSTTNRQEKFMLDLRRGGRIEQARLRYQTRAQRVYVLARLDLNGRPHRNPPEAPHRPGHRFIGTHLHVYVEGFGDKVAFLPEEVLDFPQPAAGDGISWLQAFLAYCHVEPVPPIQVSL